MQTGGQEESGTAPTKAEVDPLTPTACVRRSRRRRLQACLLAWRAGMVGPLPAVRLPRHDRAR
jgi:hypothetical protein